MQIAFAKKKERKKSSAGEEKLLSSNCKMNIENAADRVHFGRMYSLGIILNFQPKYFLQYKTRISAPISQTPNTNLSLSTRIPNQKPSFKLSQRQGCNTPSFFIIIWLDKFVLLEASIYLAENTQSPVVGEKHLKLNSKKPFGFDLSLPFLGEGCTVITTQLCLKQNIKQDMGNDRSHKMGQGVLI
jgi:hypothetical protein